MTVIAFDKNDTTKIMFKGKYESNEDAKDICELFGDDCLSSEKMPLYRRGRSETL